MLKILETPVLLMKRDELREQFKVYQKDALFLGCAFDALKDIEEWRYSTGPIFDMPPFGSQMAGFDGGRLLKKKYSSPYEARLKGAYSSGFIANQLRVVVHPSKPCNMPLVVSRYSWESNVLHVSNIDYFEHHESKSTKVPKLISISIFYDLDKSTRADVGVGDADAFSILLYYYNERNMTTAVSMVSAPFNYQNEYQMRYDAADSLEAIYTGEQVVWKRKD